MSGLELWLKSTTANSILSSLPATKTKTLKDYLLGQLSPQNAASEFVKNLDLDLGFNPCELKMKIVKLLVAIRNFRYHRKKGRRSKREMDLRNETDLSQVLYEFNTPLADDHDTPIRGGGCIRPESNYEWINLNAFLARHASANVCTVGVERVGYLCDCFLQNNEVRQDALIFNTSVSAAAQYMIYSASKVFEFCEREPTLLLRHLGWKKWKAGFQEAQTNSLIDPSGKKYAKLAVAGMNEAEVGWDRHQRLRSFDQAKHRVPCSEGIQTKREAQCGFKRSHDEAFSDSSVRSKGRIVIFEIGSLKMYSTKYIIRSSHLSLASNAKRLQSINHLEADRFVYIDASIIPRRLDTRTTLN